MQAVVDKLMTSYVRTGKGKQVLILHGWADPSAHWQSFIKELAKKYEVIMPDLPGFGSSQAPSEGWGLEEYADFVKALMTKLELKPYAIIGHSNGGAMAIHSMAAGKFSAEKLVLLGSAGIRNEYKGRNKALRVIAKTGKALASPLPGSVKKKLRRKMYETAGSDMLVAEHMQETFKKIVTDDVRLDAGQVSVPTLLIYGENDEQTPVRYGELLHEHLSDSTLEILPGADHFAYRTDQARVIKLVKEFLA